MHVVNAAEGVQKVKDSAPSYYNLCFGKEPSLDEVRIHLGLKDGWMTGKKEYSELEVDILQECNTSLSELVMGLC